MTPTRRVCAAASLTLALACAGLLAAPVRAADQPRRLAEPRAEAVTDADDAARAGRTKTVGGELLVHLEEGVTAEAATDVAEDAGTQAEELIEQIGVQVVSGASAADAERLRDDPRVERVEPNRVRYAYDDPDDPEFLSESQLFTSRLPAAWDITHGSPTIDIAVLDTGIDTNHPDLVGRIGLKKDFVNNDASPVDDNGHGTMVAGVAAADSDNGKGVAGAAWDARIMVGKVLDADGSGSDATIAAGIVWAANNGAEVINLSLGSPGANAALQNAVNHALSKKVVVVAASGNDGGDVANYPAAYSGVIAVGATDAYGDVAGFSTRGTWLDVVAQGYGVYTTARIGGPDENYEFGVGTSFSAPVVSGVAALVRKKYPTFTPSQVLQKITSNAIDRGPQGFDPHYGWGLLDAYGAVGGQRAAPPPPAVRDAAEPDDNPTDARAIGSGAEGTISPEGDEDWYTVDASSAGTITVTVTQPAGDDGSGAQTFDPMIDAFTPALASLGHFDGPEAAAPEVAAVDVGSAGTYRFRVANFASSRSTGTRTDPEPYTVGAVFAPAAVSPSPDEVEWIADATPERFATTVPASFSPTVTFARSVTEASAESSSFVRIVDGRTGAVVAATNTYNAGSKTVTIDPTSDLLAGRAYRVGVKGVSDSSDTMTEGFTLPFTAASTPVVDLRSDFDDDGFEDSVIGASGEDLGAKDGAGAVHVLYGSASGPQALGSQVWTQDSSGIGGAAESGDAFGAAVATGDLNNDGFDDLVVGAPGENLGSVADAGLIHVILGSADGLTASGSSYWTQDTTGVPGAAEPNDRFGTTLATGKFDKAIGVDVAVGAPGEGVGGVSGAGLVHFFRGSSTGLTTKTTTYWTQNSPGIEFFAETNDGFGAALASGDFHGDGHDDLAIGTPNDDIAFANEGTVMLMRGGIAGLRPSALIGDLLGPEDPEDGDRFGASLAIADLGGYATSDRYADLVVGVPGENDGGTSRGNVSIVFSDHTDPWWASQRLDQSTFGLGALESNASFGSTVAAHRLGPAGVLAIGAPLATAGGQSDAGLVHVYVAGTSLGTDGQFLMDGVRAIDQSTSGVPDDAEANDRFGWDLGLYDVDGDDASDLWVGVPFESIGALADAGSAFVARDIAGETPAYTQFVQGSGDVPDAAEAGDLFGAAV